MTMGLANLSGLIFLVSIPALILIYYFSRKKKRVEISSIIPWRLLRESVVTSSLFRADLLFFLQLLLLVGLVLAACRPYWRQRAGDEPGRHLILVMDRSASMQAREGGKSRWEEARDRALRLVSRLRRGDRVTLIAAGVWPEVLATSEGNRSRLEEILKAMYAADIPDRLAPAIDMAISAMRTGARSNKPGDDGDGEEAVRQWVPELHIFTDRTAKSLGIEKLAASGKIRLEHVGSPEGNRAITSLTVYRNAFLSGSCVSAFVTVENFSKSAFAGSLSVRSGEKEVYSKAIKLEPGGSVKTRIGECLPEGVMEVVLEPPDALPVDNRAYAVAAGTGKVRVVLFTRDRKCSNQFTALAAAIPNLELDIHSPRKYSSTDMKKYRLAIFHRCEPEEDPPTNMLIIFPPVRSRHIKVREGSIADMTFLDWDENHPVGGNLRGLNRVTPGECRYLELPPWGRAVVISAVTGGDIPLLICGEYKGRRVAVTSFDMSELELRGAGSTPLLVLLLNLISWLSSEEGDQIKTGEPYEALIPAAGQAESGGSGESTLCTVVNPRGRRIGVKVGPEGIVVFRDTEFIGRYELSGKGVERAFAANLCNRAESNLLDGGLCGDVVDVGGTIYMEVADRAVPDRTGLFLFILLALLLVEWFLYIAQRRGWVKTGKG